MDTEAITLGELHNLLQAELRGTRYPPGRRVQVALASFCIAQEHHAAITILMERGLNASAYALSRALYEATVKGIWVSHCASEEEAERYAQGKELSGVNTLIEELGSGTCPEVVHVHFKNVKAKYWRMLSSFAHAGHAQVKRWLAPDGVEPHYPDVELEEIASFAGFFAVVGAMECARLGGNTVAAARIADLLPAAREEA